jgi:hypothetical protein
MSWTSQQVMDNLVAHNACSEGRAWAIGKDSNEMWAAADEFAAPYLFWWAAKNSGQSGWKSNAEVTAVLEKITDVACRHATDETQEWQQEIARFDDHHFSDRAIYFYLQIERKLVDEKKDLTAFRIEILALVVSLRPQ